MLTRCPGCGTVFRVHARDLRAARGRVRCGSCAQRFDAIVELRDEDEDDLRPVLTEVVEPAPPATGVSETGTGTGTEAPVAPMVQAPEALAVSVPVPAGAPDDEAARAFAAPDLDQYAAVVPAPESATPTVAGDSADTPTADDVVQIALHLPEVGAGTNLVAPVFADSPKTGEATEVQQPESDVSGDIAAAAAIDIGTAALALDVQQSVDLQSEPPIGIEAAEQPAVVRDPPAAEDSMAPAFEAGDRDASLRVLLDDLPPTSVRRQRALESDAEAPRDPVQRARRRVWTAIAAVFLIALATQLLWLQRAPLVSRWPSLRPAYERVCATLKCTLAPRRALEAIRILARDVRDHPRYRDALLVNATLVNEAAFAQPFPVLELELFDVGGRRLGLRRFQPREYLDASIDLASGMAVRVPIFIVLEIGGASDTAVSFEFKLL